MDLPGRILGPKHPLVYGGAFRAPKMYRDKKDGNTKQFENIYLVTCLSLRNLASSVCLLAVKKIKSTFFVSI